MTTLSHIPPITRVSARVIRLLGLNPSMYTLQGTNTYLIGTGKERVLVDTGEGDQPEYVSNLVSTLKECQAVLKSVVLTHWHNDHVGGVLDVLQECSENQNRSIELLKFPRPEDESDERLRSVQPLSDGQVMKVEGATLTAIHTPGHTVDHVVLYLQEEDALFCGDCMLGEGTSVFEDLHDYIGSLKRMRHMEPSIIYPAHGKIIDDPGSKIDFYLAHRQQREDQIVAALKDSSSQWMTPMDIVSVVYKETPEHLHLAAAGNVVHHLEKLIKEERVQIRDSEANGKSKLGLDHQFKLVV